jgi:hypothetical protein
MSFGMNQKHASVGTLTEQQKQKSGGQNSNSNKQGNLPSALDRTPSFFLKP